MIPIITGFPGFRVADDGNTSGLPTIRGFTTYKNTSDLTTQNVTISTAQAGDLVVIWMLNTITDELDTVTVTTPSGWTRFLIDGVGNNLKVHAFWRVVTGTTSSVAFSLPGNPGNVGTGGTMYANSVTFSAHSAPDFSPVVSTVEKTVTSTHNPPAATVPGGWGINPHYYTFSCLAKLGSNSVTSTGGYTSLMNTGNGSTKMASAYSTNPNFNPPSWSTDQNNTGLAFTILVRGVD